VSINQHVQWFDSTPLVREGTVMVDWTILSPTYLTAVVEWAGAVVTVLAVGPGHPAENATRSDGR